MNALRLETFELTKRFGALTALDRVSFKVQPGTVHALLGENGAGKSTLVKCIAGFQVAEAGSIVIDERERAIPHPIAARALGIGMVYQHFTSAPGMSVAENILLAGSHIPQVIRWREQRAHLQRFIESTPFRLNLDARPSELAAGEKQKLELLKQLYLRPRLLILDEPTSVLTPQEADEVLGHVREIAHRGECTVLLITHKFREVEAYADHVTVLRRGAMVFDAVVADVGRAQLAEAMVGSKQSKGEFESQKVANDVSPVRLSSPSFQPESIALQIRDLDVRSDRGVLAVKGLSLSLHAGEILGIAGVSGNGQRELVEAITGQRKKLGGAVLVAGEPYHASRAENRQRKVRCLSEEPLRSACVADMSVAENMALRDFDEPPLCLSGLLRPSSWRTRASQWIQDYGIKTQGESAPMRSLSGGSVQRAVLARELAGEINVLIAANAVFGLDFAAVKDIHTRLRQVRDDGAGVLLISEDLDELIELSDRILVISEGRLVYETRAASADRSLLGTYMGGTH
jgi:general nucleoside transport system ATP-binding protein